MIHYTSVDFKNHRLDITGNIGNTDPVGRYLSFCAGQISGRCPGGR